MLGPKGGLEAKDDNDPVMTATTASTRNCSFSSSESLRSIAKAEVRKAECCRCIHQLRGWAGAVKRASCCWLFFLYCQNKSNFLALCKSIAVLTAENVCANTLEAVKHHIRKSPFFLRGHLYSTLEWCPRTPTHLFYHGFQTLASHLNHVES